ncbi:hypothetical protein PQE75_gp034 [Bacillus phage vB_BcoS-136]|uniref:Uncharacterized protein n=1 Tax=Bacillus phage vB_BcoS-136 TaxID=2419619 RepID=A0A3G3BVT1_9CAUD|nr:hypothetical protein PQE75_gp034 [Bacillus phage vB_BcoS-136]AYP68166.1 hypothetical protein vBBcoS136_00034 [Bacillus phage vB_BcoS-136]
MLKIDNLKERVQKAEANVEKRKSTIVRHEKTLAKKITKLEQVSGREVDLNNIDAYKWDKNNNSYSYYWEACDVSGKLRDIKDAKLKLQDAEIILQNWKDKLQKELDKDDFINNSIPKVIKDFLESWKEMAYDWHIKKHESFVDFKKDLFKREAEAIAEFGHLPRRERWAKYEELGVDNIRKRLLSFGGAVVFEMNSIKDENKRLVYLNEVLEGEKRRKAIDLVRRINEVVGEIKDASRLQVNEKGNLDGIINGEKADAKIETIGAGGYNIQCFHYRTLVHKIA